MFQNINSPEDLAKVKLPSVGKTQSAKRFMSIHGHTHVHEMAIRFGPAAAIHRIQRCIEIPFGDKLRVGSVNFHVSQGRRCAF